MALQYGCSPPLTNNSQNLSRILFGLTQTLFCKGKKSNSRNNARNCFRFVLCFSGISNETSLHFPSQGTIFSFLISGNVLRKKRSPVFVNIHLVGSRIKKPRRTNRFILCLRYFLSRYPSRNVFTPSSFSSDVAANSFPISLRCFRASFDVFAIVFIVPYRMSSKPSRSGRF